MTVKVSVIVAAYQPGEGIDRVIASLDRQSLAAEEFEVIIIDDGSPDDTFARLQAIQSTRGNVAVSRIENSGWPSRPRNIGIERARGEYVLFMDHDDYLYPDGLRRGYEYAKQTNADIVSPKESKTTDVGWSIAESRVNISDAKDRGIGSLMPMVPHKFYRRAFLLENGIRFPEGRRMLWEDIYFNVDAYRHASRISVLADTPVYRWVSTGVNNSSSYGPQEEEFWVKLIALLDFIVMALPDPAFTADREFLMLHQYGKRVLARFVGQLSIAPDAAPDSGTDSAHDAEVAMAWTFINRILTEYVPESFDRKVAKIHQPQAYLLRRGLVDMMRGVKKLDAGLAGMSSTDDVRWEDGKLVITARTRWVTAGDKPLALHERDGKLMRTLTHDIESALPPELLDLTRDIQRAKTEITIRSRGDFVTWLLPTHCEVTTEHQDSRVVVTVEARAVLDIDRAIFGRALVDPLWDFHARNNLAGLVTHRPLKAQTPVRPAFINGRSAVAYQSKPGNLALDLGQVHHGFLGDATWALERAASAPGDHGSVTFDIPIDNLAMAGQRQVSGTIQLRPYGVATRALFSRRVTRVPKLGPRLKRMLAAQPAIIVADANGLRLKTTFRILPGSYTLVSCFGDKTTALPVRMTKSLLGGSTFSAP